MKNIRKVRVRGRRSLLTIILFWPNLKMLRRNIRLPLRIRRGITHRRGTDSTKKLILCHRILRG